ncbi:OmpP1/FadL family transporter [Robertkochia solimangrovi]|uniref:OmpP1/FadL family transporter n=1 Tax=Robertkochia solimangrovi TaxID=2213046 RepID=UPI00117E66CA|nr:outer membrane protein transport protein [Robertkochia solimangrovi]TRZ42741.1 aromatic hydrocarbon degradation protein [Robertkochia solimangrovi]
MKIQRLLITLLIVGFALQYNQAQTINDVTAFGLNDLTGTARYRALSGAFGALGGDMSAMNINPAGGAVFSNSTMTISAGRYGIDNDTRYFDGFSNTNFNHYELNQVGGIMVFKNGDASSTVNKVTFGFNYELNNNFEDEYFINGAGNTSIGEYFAAYANGYTPDDLSVLRGESISDAYINIGDIFGYDAQQGFLGYQAYVIDPDGSGTGYIPNGSYSGTISQEQWVRTSGYDHKFTFNLATQLMNSLYAGINLNFHAVDRRKITQFDEYGYSDSSTLQYVQFDNELHTFGTAFSFNAGIIAKVSDMIRLGASYQSPTWYSLSDELLQGINTDVINNDSGATDLVEVYPNVILRYPDYTIQIPSKLNASAALVFGKAGLLSFDYGYQDMSNAKLKPTGDPTFAAENNYIGQSLKAVSTYRIGGEYRMGIVSLRGGYRFEESPYKNGYTIGDLTGYSFGMGLDFNGWRIDATYSLAERDLNPQLYDVGLTSTANISNQISNILLSFSFTL